MLKYFTTSLLLLLINSAHAGDFLLETQWLNAHIHDKNIRIIDMSESIQYQRFHIPGAIHLPYAAINQTTRQGVSYTVSDEHLYKVLGFLGIKNEDHIIIYDDMGGLNASRLFWALEKIGHKKMSVLNGGLVKWILEGNKVSAKNVQPGKTVYQSNKKMKSNVVSMNDIQNLVPSKTLLLDVRTKDEYQGHPKQVRSGHIPGAKWWEWQQAVNFENGFQLQQQDQLNSQLKQLGLTAKEQPVVLYCRSGHRASHSYFVLRQLGYSNVKIYDGSMAEYYQYKTAPLKQGMLP